jgi:hypothetical protein
LQARGSEIDQKSVGLIHGGEVTHQLNLVILDQRRDRFQFDDEPALDKQVCTELADYNALVADLQRFLYFCGDLGFPLFDEHRVAIHMFEKARSERAMHFHRETNHSAGQILRRRLRSRFRQMGGLHGLKKMPFRDNASVPESQIQ